jgi:hypothetical protein
LKPGKSAKVSLNTKLTGDQSGTFIYVTDTNNTVITSVEVP